MRTLLQIAQRRLTMLAGLAVGAGVMTVWGPASVLELDRADLPTDRAPSGRPLRLAAAHDCWTGAAPADMKGRIPGHVVVTTPGGRTVYSARLVGPALEQTFDGQGAGLVVHAFCR